jgi:pyrroloquinoline quinone biosynthesis protein B
MATVEILGVAQDAGVPHLGCRCGTCASARANPERRRYASAIRLDDGGRYLFDATPDVRFQLATVPDGVFLTHAHLGHLPGLLYFGQESVATDELPVYATPGLKDVIREEAPHRLLVEQQHVDLQPVTDQTTVPLETATVTAIQVPHRESLPTKTLAYRIDGQHASLLYMTDIDTLTPHAESLIRDVDVALLDGTFWNENEIDRVEEVPHPTVESSIAALDDVSTDVFFTHLNHTNPLLDPDSDARETLESTGFRIAERGHTFEL